MITIRSFVLFMSVLLLGQVVAAQQGPQMTQYMLNRYQLNPAFGGLSKSLSVTAGIRSQWNQFEGAPRTQFINAHLPLYGINGSAGFAIENDQTGPLNRLVLSGSYNYVFESVLGLMSFGGRVGINQININGSLLRTPTGSYIDNSIDHNDPILLSTDMIGVSPWWGLGLYIVNEFGELGVSLDNVPSNNFSGGNSRFTPSQLVSIFIKSDFIIGDQFIIAPNMLVKTDFVQTQLDIGAMGYYEKGFGGINLRGYNSDSLDAINFIGGAQISENIRLSYSFDLGINGLNTFHEGTHEFVINYNLNKKIRTGELPPIIYNPRYN